MPLDLHLAGAACAKAEPLLGFVCSGAPQAIRYADIGRWACLMLGVINTALYLRMAVQSRRGVTPGLAWRLLGACLTSYFVAVTEWDQMARPVTLRLPLGIIGLVAFTIGGLRFRSDRESDRETELAARMALLESRGQR